MIYSTELRISLYDCIIYYHRYYHIIINILSYYYRTQFNIYSKIKTMKELYFYF